MKRDVIIACDFPTAADTLAFLDRLAPRRPYVKIGMELFYAEGPSIVRALKDRGHPVFLDLKLHDIPNTVGRAMSRLASLGVDMLNLHAAGGSEMMRYALDGLSSGTGTRPLLLAVTQLTSTSQQRMTDELLIDRPLPDVVVSYARLARSSGLDGVVCSPLESALVRDACGDAFLTVTPGVRFVDGDLGDQSRVTTPAKARALGSHYIVVGRPVTAAPDPLAAYLRCVDEFVG